MTEVRTMPATELVPVVPCPDDTGERTAPIDLPLAVDLDRTLLLTDTLVEAFLLLFLSRPLAALRVLLALRGGRAAFKTALVDAETRDGAWLFNEELRHYLEVEKARGRPLHLVTASDQRVADTIAQLTGLFRSTHGTRSGLNLKGARKREFLCRKFPNGFAYAGDSAADLAVWKEARAAILVGVSPATRRAFEGLGCPIELELRRDRQPVRDWLKLMRVHQWSKNVLIFVPLVLSQTYTDLSAAATVLVGFLAFGLTASGTYIVNDVADIDADRRHPTKSGRPIARGAIDAGQGIVGAATLVAAGMALMALASPVAALWLVVYVAITLTYSFGLKRMPLLDIFALGSLYTLRVVIGTFLVGTLVSPWLLMFSFFFFFSLSMAKRHVEIIAGGAPGALSRMIEEPRTIAGRGYSTGDAPLTLTLGIGTMIAAVLILSLYVTEDIAPELYASRDWLWGVIMLVFAWSSRIWLLSHRGELDADPVAFAMRDRISLLMAVAVGTLFLLSVY